MSRTLPFTLMLLVGTVAACASSSPKQVDYPELSDDAGSGELVEAEERPPAPREHDLVFESRPGHVWVEGHWVLTRAGWMWQPGRYVSTRPGHVYVQGRWERRGSRWVWVEGHWLAARQGHVWRRGYWQRDRGGWIWIPGEWVSTRPGHVWQPGRWHRDTRGRRVWIEGRWVAGH
jgi:hypothetical protein